jgi:AcrR family transcriptional regulator
MITEMKKRKYRLNQRALQQDETRERIVDAAIALHQEIGPAATTISALAERAGVQRLTVYRHFAAEGEILRACSSKWLGQHPPPDPAAIADGDGAEHTRRLLLALYAYYEETQAMWRSLYRDRATMQALEEPMRAYDDYLAMLAAVIQGDWSPGRSKRLRATIAHALQFTTWQSLNTQGLANRAIAALVGEWIGAAAA